MKQRYQIAKALLSDPCVLILDEPTVGLDVESAITVRDIIKRLRREGRTILLTTHNLFEAEELCDRIAFINHGHILATGTVEELKGNLIRNRTIEVNCSDSTEVVERLSRIKGVDAVQKSGRLALVSVDSYARMKDIMKALSGVKSEIYNLSALEPTLEETYLSIINKPAGRHGRDGEEMV
jgi:ABC-2 type transport system ATP-binding protein